MYDEAACKVSVQSQVEQHKRQQHKRFLYVADIHRIVLGTSNIVYSIDGRKYPTIVRTSHARVSPHFFGVFWRARRSFGATLDGLASRFRGSESGAWS
jgi:hypothetical protein